MVGALSVPPSWAVATPTVRLAAAVLHGSGAAAATAVVAQSAGNLFSQMGLAGLAGAAVGGTLPRAVNVTPARAGRPAADNDSKTPEKLKRVLAELSQKPESAQHWHTDKAHLQSLLDQLSNKPGVHGVHLSSASNKNPTQAALGLTGRKCQMPFVTTKPELLAAATGDLHGVGSAMAADNASAAGPTTGVIPAPPTEDHSAATHFAGSMQCRPDAL